MPEEIMHVILAFYYTSIMLFQSYYIFPCDIRWEKKRDYMQSNGKPNLLRKKKKEKKGKMIASTSNSKRVWYSSVMHGINVWKTAEAEILCAFMYKFS